VTAVGGTNLVTSAAPGSLDSAYVSENGWSDPEIPYDPYGIGAVVSGGFWGAGGGFSGYFARPSWQAAVNTGSTTQRAVPDVGMQVGGCPGGISKLDHGACDGGNLKQNGAGNRQRSFVIVSIGAGQTGGGFYGVIGTSVAAPELAGATALLIERYGRLGNLNTYLYQLASLQAAGKGVFFHTNIPGFNGLAQTNLNPAYSLTTGVGTPIVNIYTTAGAVELSGTPLTATNP
jgi:subtilase family serine protease